jgi:hypothetical protein
MREEPADYRLAFRELGMSIGLHSVPRMIDSLLTKPLKVANSQMRGNYKLSLHPERMLKIFGCCLLIIGAGAGGKNTWTIPGYACNELNSGRVPCSVTQASDLSFI